MSAPGTLTDFVQRYVKTIWTDREIDRLGEFLADDCVLSDLYGDNVMRGLATIKQSVAQWANLMEGVNARLLHAIEGDGEIAWQWSLSGRFTDQAPVRTTATQWPGGDSLVFAGITFSTVVDGKVIREQTQADIRGLIEQMGYSLR